MIELSINRNIGYLLLAAAAASATAVAASAVAAATFACEALDGLGDFLVGSGAGGDDLSGVVERLAGIEVVAVQAYAVGAHLYDDGIEMIAVLIDEGDDVSLKNLILHEFAVHCKDALRHVDDALFHVGAIGLFGLESEVEGVALGERGDVLFKSVEGHAHIADELEGMFGGGLFEEFLLSFRIGGEEVVGYGDVFVHIRKGKPPLTPPRGEDGGIIRLRIIRLGIIR